MILCSSLKMPERTVEDMAWQRWRKTSQWCSFMPVQFVIGSRAGNNMAGSTMDKIVPQPTKTHLPLRSGDLVRDATYPLEVGDL